MSRPPWTTTFAVIDGLIGQRPKRLYEGGISEVEVIVVAGSEMHLAACLDGQRPVAVQLNSSYAHLLPSGSRSVWRSNMMKATFVFDPGTA
jgi:hypothetical protein